MQFTRMQLFSIASSQWCGCCASHLWVILPPILPPQTSPTLLYVYCIAFANINAHTQHTASHQEENETQLCLCFISRPNSSSLVEVNITSSSIPQGLQVINHRLCASQYPQDSWLTFSLMIGSIKSNSWFRETIIHLTILWSLRLLISGKKLFFQNANFY